MMALDERLEPVLTPITQKVQLRVYRSVSAALGEPPGGFSQSQTAHEFVMRRQELVAGVAGGLHLVTPEEQEFQRLLMPMQRRTAAAFTGPVVLRTCAVCHSAGGIFSVRSYIGFGVEGMNVDGPQLMSVDEMNRQGGGTSDQGALTAHWKKRQFDWGLLQGILAANRAP